MQSPREINNIVMRREAENERLRVEVEERNSLLSKASATIQVLQGELNSSRRELELAQNTKEEALRVRDQLQEAELMLLAQEAQMKKTEEECTAFKLALESSKHEMERIQREQTMLAQKSKEREKRLLQDLEQSEAQARRLKEQVVKLEASAKESEVFKLEHIKYELRTKYEREAMESKSQYETQGLTRQLEDHDKDWARRLQEVESICERRLRDGMVACEAQFRDETREFEMRLRQLDQDWHYRVSEIERGWADRMEEERKLWQREKQEMDQKLLGSRAQGEQEATKNVLAVQSRLREALVLSQQAAMREREAIIKDTEEKLRSQRDQHKKEMEEARRAGEQKEKDAIREKELSLMKALKERDRGYSWRR